MTKPLLTYICPQYNAFVYTWRAVRSFFKYSPDDSVVIIPDDDSSNFDKQNWDDFFEDLPRDRIILHHFESNAGLTRGWNWGCTKAREIGAKYTIVGNNDVLFTPGWHEGLIHNLNRGFMQVGPVTNAPGYYCDKQNVKHYFKDYKVNDDHEYLHDVARSLRKHFNLDQIQIANPNGFFMMARTETWWKGKYNEQYVFNPHKKMKDNETELQDRWNKKKWRMGFVPTSFIFHYRAVSREEKWKHPGWHRLADMHKPI